MNVQPYSGSPANLAVYLAFCQPHDTIMGLGLPAGGQPDARFGRQHHGQVFKSVGYNVSESDQRIDFAEVRRLALEHKPKILWCGTTAYPRTLDLRKIPRNCREVGGEIVRRHCPHRRLGRGRRASVAGRSRRRHHQHDAQDAARPARRHRDVQARVRQGHRSRRLTHNHTTAGIAVAAKEGRDARIQNLRARGRRERQGARGRLAQQRLFARYGRATDNHLILIDLRSKNVTGKLAAQALDRAGIVGNYNSIPFDPRKPFDPSGFRIGTPSITSRGMGKDEMLKLADFMAQVVSAPDDTKLIEGVAAQVKELCLGFPPPGIAV